MFSAKQIRSRFFPAGSAAAPSIAFQASKTTGFYLNGTDQIRLSILGVNSFVFAGDGLLYGGGVNPYIYLKAGTGGVVISAAGTNQSVQINPVGSGALLVGTPTNSGNGILQLATHTTSAGGIGFGTDVSLYRTAANSLRLAGASLDITTGPLFCATGITSYGPTSGIGYSTGAGGTVTQNTSKSTAVTLNKVCGQITMHAAALAAGAAVEFTHINSAVASNADLVIASHCAGGTLGSYTITPRTSAGAVVYRVTNISVGSLSEAIVITFQVLKGVTS